MNRVVFRLVADYLRRTVAVWPFVALIQVMQASLFLAHGIDRMPVIAAMIGAASFAKFGSPDVVLRTLPVRREDVALVRWWVGTGWPTLLGALCILVAWGVNIDSGYPAAHVWMPLLAAVATPSLLAALPLPSLAHTEPGFSRARFVFVVLAVVGLHGLPVGFLPDSVVLALGLGGAALGVLSFLLASWGHVVRLRLPSLAKSADVPRVRVENPPRVQLRGWSVILVQLLKSSLWLTVVSLAVVTLLRYTYPSLANLPGMMTGLRMLFVMAVGVGGMLLARRWLAAMPALQILPIRASMLAFMTCLALAVPSFVACIVATGVNLLVPEWSIRIPLFYYPLFAILPAQFGTWRTPPPIDGVPTALHRYAPILSGVVWPMTVVLPTSLTLTNLMPTWFGAVCAVLIVVFIVAGYFVILGRIRSGQAVERSAPLTAQ